VIDLKNKQFREGMPHDYISYSTNNNYIPFCEIPEDKICEINRFMESLFPDKELCNYMWEHLASAISGQIHSQTFNYYIGEGRNGKSIISDLMKKSLGDYMCYASINIVLEDLPKQGSANPDLLALKGIRYAVMPEPSKGKVLKEGVMKTITSGVEEIQARGLFKDPVSFTPQVTLVVCANVFLKIDTQDEGTWRRIRATPFVSKFTENPSPSNPYEFKVDFDMPNKIEGFKEYFISLLVHKYFQTEGAIGECKIVDDKSKEYRSDEDYISQFIDINIDVVDDFETRTDVILTITDLGQRFRVYKDAGYNGPTKFSINDIRDAINKKFSNHIRYKTSTSSNKKNTVFWQGLKLRNDE
jgi:putative DNA primase/helicase